MSINKFGFRSFTEDNQNVGNKLPNMFDNYVKSNPMFKNPWGPIAPCPPLAMAII